MSIPESSPHTHNPTLNTQLSPSLWCQLYSYSLHTPLSQLHSCSPVTHLWVTEALHSVQLAKVGLDRHLDSSRLRTHRTSTATCTCRWVAGVTVVVIISSGRGLHAGQRCVPGMPRPCLLGMFCCKTLKAHAVPRTRQLTSQTETSKVLCSTGLCHLRAFTVSSPGVCSQLTHSHHRWQGLGSRKRELLHPRLRAVRPQR